MKIISDRDVLHRAGTSGVVVTRVQVIEDAEGNAFVARYWSDFRTGDLRRVDSVAIEKFVDEIYGKENIVNVDHAIG